jgi:hypothetical protein
MRSPASAGGERLAVVSVQRRHVLPHSYYCQRGQHRHNRHACSRIGGLAMNGAGRRVVLRLAVMLGVASLSAQSLAVDSSSRPASPRHQLMLCMTKQMSASRTISYNEATKVCKAQLKSQSAALAASGGGKSAGGLSR